MSLSHNASVSRSKNLSQHLDFGTSAVPASTRLPAVALNGQASNETESPVAAPASEATDDEQVCFRSILP